MLDGEDANEEDVDNSAVDEEFLPSSKTGGRPSWHSLSALSSAAGNDEDSNLSPAVRALMAQFSSSSGGGKNELDELPETTPKIIYASRTHSQLSQFVAELKKTAFGKDLTIDTVGEEAMDSNGEQGVVRVIALGSRKQMCIHEGVQKIGLRAGTEAMNEACRELASSSSSNKKRCEFLPPMDELGRSKVLDFRDRAMAEVRDIEDLVELGKEMKTCPYYAARTSARQAQLVTMPYNFLLQRNARESLGISLKDSVVLIDESHNLIDTILAVYTCFVTSTQITTAKGQINEYLRRFGSRLRGESEMMLRTFRRLLEGLERLCSRWQQDSQASEEVWTAARIVSEMGGNLDTVNFAQLERFLKDTQIARKVSGYAQRVAEKTKAAAAGTEATRPDKKSAARSKQTSDAASSPLPPSAIAAMHSLESFVLSLSNRTQDGRVLLTRHKSPSDSTSTVGLKYQLLNPSESFKSIVDEARSVILAGGTMEPISDIRHQLVPSLGANQWSTFSCGHIVPRSNLLCNVVSCGPRGTPFEFKYEKRGDPAVLDDLGNSLANFASLIPHGIVVFLPSYKFLDDVVARWRSNGIWNRLENRKRLFTEPKSTNEVEGVLRAYSAGIDAAAAPGAAAKPPVTGSLLLAVVGAKLSEGINFSDRLARAVIMVGMPFPNSQSAELAERMRYVREVASKGEARTTTTKSMDAGQELYTNICMKAVNQSIGRAIRHQNDFAALLLLDRRYGRADIRARLPGWIRDEVKVHASTGSNGFGPVMKDLGVFFREKREKGLL